MTEAEKNLKQVSEIRTKLQMGAMTYDQAKAALQPVITALNTAGQAIAVKYGKKHKPFTATGLLR